MHEQRSNEWHMARLGHVTASKFADVLTEPRSKAGKAAGKLSGTAMRYLRRLRGDILAGSPAESITTKAMQHGIDHEDDARRRYEFVTGTTVIETGFITHPSEGLIGGSPDGLVSEDGLIEIKCPFSREEMEAYRDGEFEQHTAQMQGLLWITDREWCDFVAYSPDYGEDFDIAIHRVVRDESYIEKMAKKVIAFRDILKESTAETARNVRQRIDGRKSGRDRAA